MPTLLPLCPFYFFVLNIYFVLINAGCYMWVGYNLARDKDA